MSRVYLHYSLCEEFRPGGMWRIVAGAETRTEFATAAADLMRDTDRFLEAMLRAIDEWPNSCAMNLTAPMINHRAWFGHAGCFLATDSPEDCTRQGWHMLTPSEQEDANAAADCAISRWRALRPVHPAQEPLFEMRAA